MAQASVDSGGQPLGADPRGKAKAWETMMTKIWNWLTAQEDAKVIARRAATHAYVKLLANQTEEQLRRMGLDYLLDREKTPPIPFEYTYLMLAPLLEHLLNRIERLERSVENPPQ
jgi:hypothetical protein